MIVPKKISSKIVTQLQENWPVAWIGNKYRRSTN